MHIYLNFQILRFFEGLSDLEYYEATAWGCARSNVFTGAIYKRLKDLYSLQEIEDHILEWSSRPNYRRTWQLYNFIDEIKEKNDIELLEEFLSDLDMGL